MCYNLVTNNNTEEEKMSLQKIQSIFKSLNTCEAWSIQLLRIKTSKNKETEYASISINLTPEGKLKEFVEKIKEHFAAGSDCELKSYLRVQDYDGTTDGNVIYKLHTQDLLIKEEYESFITALAHSEHEADPLNQKLQAYVIMGDIEVDDEKIGIKMISMQNPVTILKHKFLHENNTFKEIEAKVLSLRPVIDVLIFKDEIYFLSMAGEKLFNMDRAYKAVCENKVLMLEESGILFDSSMFGNVARTGHHPRMFVSFNEKRYERLKNKKERKRYAELFEIPMKDGKFDMSEEEAADKLVRLLCNKGMVDPFEDLPVEVSGARKWK